MFSIYVFKSSTQISTPPLISAIKLSSSEAKHETKSNFLNHLLEIWKFKTILWDLDGRNLATTFKGNEFDYREKPQQIIFLPNSANESTNAGSNLFIE